MRVVLREEVCLRDTLAEEHPSASGRLFISDLRLGPGRVNLSSSARFNQSHAAQPAWGMSVRRSD